jgi:ubiquinone/menaquinone biosynthesis C-methylase UbiE
MTLVRSLYFSPDCILELPYSPALTGKDEWSKFAPSFMKLARDGPGIAPAADMVKSSNALFPFSSATTIIDIGCGPGQITSEVLKAHGTELPASSRLLATDLAPGMIEQVKKRKEEELANGDKLWDKVETQLVDATDLSAFADGSVSHALSGFVLFMVPRARNALREIHRVLAPAGVFQTSSWQGSEWMELMGFPGKIKPERSMPQMPPTWRTIEGVKGELEATGFRDVDVHTVEAYMPFESYDEVAKYILTQFPMMGKMTAGFTQTELEKTRDLMVDYIKAKHPSVPGKLVGTAIVGVGRK